jgi:hypothetical protein
MSMRDRLGNPVSYGNAAAVRALDAAIEKLHAYQLDPLADVDAVLAEHPEFVMAHAFRAAMLATTTDRAFEPELARSVTSAEALITRANPREQAYIAAARAWLDGDLERGADGWGRIAIEYPLDLLAIQVAHVSDFFLGYSHMLRDRVARVLPHWSRTTPGYGFLRGMHAFGLEESGDYAAAEEAGRESVSLNPRDGWAAHAVAHALEMQGRTADGIKWLSSTADGWSPNSGFAYHNWWHLALFHLDNIEPRPVLELFDTRVAAGGFGQALELIDGSALLWRLTTIGVDVGNRWTDVADKWASRVEHGIYAFNDVHAMLAFVGADRKAERQATIATLERCAAGQGTNAMMAREVGLPAAKGLAAFGRGDYRACIDLLLPVRGKANRFGGSHAQRDLFSWTLVQAALRLGDRRMADAMLAERLAAKPHSALNRSWAAQIGKVAARNVA